MVEQLTLDHHARSSDPETSHAAARSASFGVSVKADVLSALAASGRDGLTRDELALCFGVHPNTITNVLNDNHTDTLDERADMMEAMLGGATKDDGCYDASVPENTLVPDALIDNNDPLSILLADEVVLEKGLDYWKQKRGR